MFDGFPVEVRITGLYRASMSEVRFQAGPYRGICADGAALTPGLIETLAGVQTWMQAGDVIHSLGRHGLARHEIHVHGQAFNLAIKSFARGSWLRDRYFARYGSKAERSFLTAVQLQKAGVGTPAPFAFLDRWEGGRLLESYYLCAYQENITSFREELNRLYRDDPLCRRIMTLMETVALAIADMHDAGVCHRDLGNQNILLRRDGEDRWKDVQFIDLNRAHRSHTLTTAQRARDISRIDLPSDFLRVFLCMYFRHRHPDELFKQLEARYRRRFARHTATRKYRRPIRQYHQRKKDALLPFVPRGKELWVWDDRSVQAVSTLLKRDRRAYYPISNHVRVAASLVGAAGPVWSNYRAYLHKAFQQPVRLAGRTGVAIGPVASPAGREAGLIEHLGLAAVLVRLYRHEPDEVNDRALEEIRHWKQQGRSVLVALVQDREAVRTPARWRAFVEQWVPPLKGLADWLEIGHAVNRVKWGLWDVREYRPLVEPVVRAAGDQIPLCGPAVIDFEYHFLPAFLDQVPAGALSALSHHLYVDRRGAPENRQGRFGAVEKFALAKAIATWSPAVRGDRLIVSEVNWPLRGTGEFSPVNSPYIIPGSHTDDPSVDEEAYASYLVRYIALALCSGLVDQVYWWRLVARGFGLVDDTEPEWRMRPAYLALQVFLRELGDATFVERLPTPAGAWALRFERPGRPGIILAWAHPSPLSWMPEARVRSFIARDGHAHAITGAVTLYQSPVYLIVE